MYLMIRNPGVSDPRAFTLLGVSTSRSSDNQNTIGHFGSGIKSTIALLLRKGIESVVCCGLLKMRLFTKTEIINGRKFRQVHVTYSGKDPITGKNRSGCKDLGFTLEWGEQDWTEEDMALREFVANAIDGALANGHETSEVEFKLVEEPFCKSGWTSVFLSYTKEIEAAHARIHERFLHFQRPELLQQRLLDKVGEDGAILFYKKGVLVYKAEETNSHFDYNLGDSLKLDESRNANANEVEVACAKAISAAEVPKLTELLKAVNKDHDLWEANLSSYCLGPNHYDSRDDSSARFKTAWERAFGPEAVASSGETILDSFVQAKGFRTVAMPPNWLRALKAHAIPTESTVLSGLEHAGRTCSEATPEMQAALDWAWGLLEAYKVTNDKEKPPVKGFKPLMDGGTQVWGLYEEGVVYLHESLGTGKLARKVALEECVHHASGSGDCSRDIQDFLLSLMVEIMT